MSDGLNMGFLRVGAAVPKVRIASPQANAEEMIRLIKQADEVNVNVLVFPELCLTGYTCADLFHQRLLLSETTSALQDILEISRNAAREMLIVVGIPIEADNQLFNCAAILHNGKILGLVPKVFIPNYNEFYEKRWFSPARNRVSEHITLCGQVIPFGENLLFTDNVSQLCLGAEICEDLWMPVPPSSRHALRGANLLVNLSASNELVGKTEYREALIRQQSARCLAGYIYSSAGPSESTTDVVFGGHMLIAENGMILDQNRFQDGTIIYADVDIEKMMNERRKSNSFMDDSYLGNYRIIPFTLYETAARHIGDQHDTALPISARNTRDKSGLKRTIDPYPFVPSKKGERDLRCREIFKIQQTGLAQRLIKTGIRKAVIGISGGLDSTLALLVCREAFATLGYPLADIQGITMPGFGTTGRTVGNARMLIQEMGISYREIPIQDACLKHFQDIGHDPDSKDVTYENVQARERMQILMDIANKDGGIVVGTGDLSELALGWCTYNGDHMSHYGVNAGVPKTLVKYLVSWYADTTDNPQIRRILTDILDTPISPELLPPDSTGKIEQKTEELIGSYDLHDFFLYNMMRWGFSPSKVYYLACQAFNSNYSRQEILKWLKVFYRRFFAQQFKRSCLPDGPKVGSICLSPRGDWRMPSDASADIWLKELEKLE